MVRPKHYAYALLYLWWCVIVGIVYACVIFPGTLSSQRDVRIGPPSVTVSAPSTR